MKIIKTSKIHKKEEDMVNLLLMEFDKVFSESHKIKEANDFIKYAISTITEYSPNKNECLLLFKNSILKKYPNVFFDNM